MLLYQAITSFKSVAKIVAFPKRKNIFAKKIIL
jgi:hypothetical protein